MNVYRLTFILSIFYLCGHNAKAQSPGGIGTSGLLLWLKADAGTNTTTAGGSVTTWKDQSGNGNDVAQYSVGAVTYAAPEFIFPDNPSTNYSISNYNPGLYFNNSFLYRAAPGVFGSGTNYNNLNYYAVYNDTTNKSFQWIIYHGANNGYTRFSQSTFWTSTPTEVDFDVPTPNRLYFNSSTTSSLMLTSFLNSTSTIGTTGKNDLLYLNSASQAMGTTYPTNTFTAQNADFQIGANELNLVNDAGPYPYYGYLHEVIIYTNANSILQRQQIESYLGIKYGLTLDSTGLSGAYLNSAGTAVFSGGSGMKFWNQVIGIARDSASGGGGLYQRQSHQQDDSTRIYLGTLQSNNMSNSSTFTNNVSYVMMGNNQGNLCSDQGAYISQTPSAAPYRLDREWKIQVTGSTSTTNVVDNFNMDVMLSSCAWGSNSSHAALANVAGLGLLINNTSNLSTGTFIPNYNIYSGKLMSIGWNGTSGQLTITNLNAGLMAYLNSTSLNASTTPLYFTIAATDPTILPIKLNSFTATADNNEYVDVKWQMQSEQGLNAYIIERSADGIEWTDVARLSPNRNDQNEPVNYDYTDKNPLPGNSYYRLGMIDLSGNISYSDIRQVSLKNLQFGIEKIAPNPFSSEITLAINLISQGNISIFIKDIFGKTVDQLNINGNKGQNTITLHNLQNLSAGIYFLQANFVGQTATQKMIKLN